ncbi:MAG: radical SAM protein [Planctomycetaceae bacterium]|nr:radical SAM protein [Planctomycetaceae bacterium]
MSRGDRSQPMPVKYWSSAGLILTYRCTAACASCYLGCSPGRGEAMSVETALEYWRQLIAASPHGCRIHLTGGEPFTDWPALIDLCRRARQEGLGPLEKVETNAFWADDESLVAARVRDLDEAGMGKLAISADPYHQQFVPIERCRLAARVAETVLGPARVQVRWRDWLDEGFDTDAMSDAARGELFARYAAGGRDRFNGRAAREIGDYLPLRHFSEFADKVCGDVLLRGRGVHVDGRGCIMPGTCAGIELGVITRQSSVGDIWNALAKDLPQRAVLWTLCRSGPAGLAQHAMEMGFQPRHGYAGKCHLCWDVRRFLAARGAGDLGPRWMYEVI